MVKKLFGIKPPPLLTTAKCISFQGILSFLTALIVSLTLSSCGSDDNDEPQEPGAHKPIPTLTARQLMGVWTLGDDKNLYFIYFDGTNEYSLCLNDRIMGAGTYTLVDNQVILKNQYLKYNDPIDVSIDNNQIKLSGQITLFNGFDKEYINLVLSLSNENAPASIVGKQWHSGMILAKPTDYTEYVNFISEYTAQHYSIRDNYKKERFNEYMMYYIHRNGLTYTQKVDGSGIVNIYDLSFNSFLTLGNSLSKKKVN